MAWRFSVTTSARRDIEKLPALMQARIEKKLRDWQAQADPLGHAVPLVAHHQGSHRFRVGPYRIIVKRIGSELRILRIRHRKDVYR